MTKKEYNEESITVLRDDMKRLQKRPEMYIGYKGWMAFLHLSKEIIQNSIDEANEDVSSCDVIYFDFDEKTNKVTVEDNGRGIPIGKAVDVCTVINSSGKFNNDNYKFSAGLNGVGLKATNALSKYCKVTILRDGNKYEMFFENGVLIKDKLSKHKSNKTGTKVEFIPNEKYLGKYDIDYNEFIKLCKTMAYLCRVKIKSHMSLLGKDNDVNAVYYFKNGIVDLLHDTIAENKENMITKPVYFKNECDDMGVEVAFAFTSGTHNLIAKSYCNFCTTVDGGYHVSGVTSGITSVLIKYIRANLLNKNESDLSITAADCLSGLICIINAKHIDASFVGQVKEKLGNLDMEPYAKTVTQSAVTEWINNCPDEAKRIGMLIKKTAKNRLENNKERQKVVSNNITALTVDTKKYARARIKPVELIIIEGDSAGGTAKGARDDRYQEVVALKGVPKGSYGQKYSKLSDNDEYRLLANVIGTDFGKKFNMSKCRYEKIIIGTDADIDGNKITVGVATFFLCHMREIVERGMLYKVIPPLYRIESGQFKGKYLNNKKEQIEFLEKQIAKKLTIKKDGKLLTDKQIITLLDFNRGYLRALTKASNKVVVEPFLVEYILNQKLDNKTNKKIVANLNKEFKFLTAIEYKNKIEIEGVFNKEFQVAIIDDKFLKRTSDVMNLINKNIDKFGVIRYDVNGEILTLGQLLKIVKDYEPTLTRFKGLGEMNAKDLWDTTLDPNNRTLIRLTTKDLEKSIEDFALIASKKKRQERSELFKKFKLDFEDLDS